MIEKPTFFERFASRAPFVITEDELLYQIGDRSPRANQNYVQVHPDRQLALIPFSSLSELESFERERFDAPILAFQQKFIREAIEHELKSREDIKKLCARYASSRIYFHRIVYSYDLHS